MASRLTTPASSPARQKHSPKLKSKKKTKEKNSPNGEMLMVGLAYSTVQELSPKQVKLFGERQKKVQRSSTTINESQRSSNVKAAEMGCSQSQAVIVQSTKTENSHMQPTIFMVGEKSLEMLRELGELKFYHLAQYNEVENTAQSPHYDFAAQLENPLQYFRDAESKASNYEVAKRSACKIKTDYLISNGDGLTEQESGHGVSNVSSTLPCDSDNQIATKNAVSPTVLSTTSLGHSNAMDIEIIEKNTSISPILLSTAFPSHSKAKDKITALNLSPSPSHDRTKSALTPKTLRRELNPETSPTTSKTSSATHPLDEIVSAPNVSCTTPTTPSNGGNITPKTKTKTFFGRNRIMPKRDISDKHDVTKSEHETPSHTGENS